MALYLHGCLLKNIMKIQAKIEPEFLLKVQ